MSHSQFPRPDFHRQVQRHYGLQDTGFPQDPTDEPAEKLLERIRQQRQPATKMYNGRLGTRRARRPRRTSDPLLPFPRDDGNGQGGKP